MKQVKIVTWDKKCYKMKNTGLLPEGIPEDHLELQLSEKN
jgi:hypothetical protein